MRVVHGLLVALCGFAALPAAAADPASEWLVRVSDAARQATYQGVVVYRDARTMEVLRVVHRNKDGRVQERLTSLTGQPRDVIQEGDQVACAVGDRPVEAAGGMPSSLFPAMSAQTLSEAAQHYQFRDLGEARVAGRSCRGVLMEPRDEFRYGYEVCADSSTAVPLRVTLRDARGQTVEQLMFTEVAFPTEIADAAFALPQDSGGSGNSGAAAARAETVMAANGPDSWQLAQLPPGFRVVGRSQRPGEGGGIVEHVLLSDGLSAVSVFGAKRAAGQMFSGFSHMGAMNAYGRAVGAFHVTVVGEVPQSTVRLIGDGFQPPAK
jgi:sigma-E factor negative regulatory protein RseB